MDQVIVSVCIPTYNGAQYLEECLESAIAQTYPYLEILVVDDQSTDRTLEIAASYQQRDPRIRICRNEKNLGLVANWNKCLELARGEWIKYLFQDDVLAPDCLAVMMEQATPQTPFLVCERRFIIGADATAELRKFYEESVITLAKAAHGQTHFSPAEAGRLALQHMGGNFIGEPTSVLFKKSILASVGFFNVHLVQLCDLEFWYRAGINYGITYIPQVLASFRVHIGSASAANHEKHHFRLSYLDPVIMIHAFLASPVYRPLRAQEPQQLTGLTKSLIYYLEDTQREALGNPERTKVLEDVLQLFPTIRLYQQHLLLKQQVPWSVKLRRYARKLVKW